MTVKKNRRKQRFRTVSTLSHLRPILLIYAIVGIPIRAGYDSSTGPSGMELLGFAESYTKEEHAWEFVRFRDRWPSWQFCC